MMLFPFADGPYFLIYHFFEQKKMRLKFNKRQNLPYLSTRIEQALPFIPLFYSIESELSRLVKVSRQLEDNSATSRIVWIPAALFLS
ncbi:hypothetical protein D3C78_1556980 [compost metagenome]